MTVAEATRILTAADSPFAVEIRDIRGIPTRCWVKAPNNLIDLLEGSKGYGDRTFLVFEDERLTFQEHYQRVASLASALQGMGVGKGDRVVIAMRNYPDWVITFWATVALGAIAVPLNAWWTGPELEYGVSDSGAKVLVLDDERTERLLPHMEELFNQVNFTVIHTRTPTRVVDQIPSGIDHFEFGSLVGDLDAVMPAVEVDSDDDVTIFYTSGTTGKPKGAVATHRNLGSNLINAFFVATRAGMLAKERAEAKGLTLPESSSAQKAYLLSVPLFHATGCFAVMIPNMVAGAKLVMMYRWNPERALELIERESITSFGGVPAMVWQVLNSPDFDKRDTTSVENIGYGGAPSAPELVRRIKQHFPTGSPSNGYGMTETCAIATMNVGDDYVRKPDSAGPPVPISEAKVVDALGSELPVNMPGELWMKGANVVRGYWNKPEATASTFSEGWLHTGDIAFIDEEGFIHIVDRAKDMLIRGGENIYSVEIESAIFENPAVADVAVIGIPDLVLGEEVCAIVQRRAGFELSEDEVRSHVAERLANFKVPKYVYFRDDELPRNAAGKILKRQLRDEVIDIEVNKA